MDRDHEELEAARRDAEVQEARRARAVFFAGLIRHHDEQRRAEERRLFGGRAVPPRHDDTRPEGDAA
jgi:hypothetical protein